jgi:Fe2+ or Zn2+ uptake regulation protein
MHRRFSAQKKMIEDTLCRLDHPTAAEVYEEVRRRCPQISLGTVYRNLGVMCEEGAALRLSFGDGPDRYDVNISDHFHAECAACGRIFDACELLPPDLIARLDAAVESATGVRVERRTMYFQGVCAACRK